MKVYLRIEESKFNYPEDMACILTYLNEHGVILVEDSTIEDLYYTFSEEQYSAGWMGVNDEILAEFENWLIDVEL